MPEQQDDRGTEEQEWEAEFRRYLAGEVKAYDAGDIFRDLIDPQWKGKAARARYIHEARD